MASKKISMNYAHHTVAMEGIHQPEPAASSRQPGKMKNIRPSVAGRCTSQCTYEEQINTVNIYLHYSACSQGK
jgi:hypothetical protein